MNLLYTYYQQVFQETTASVFFLPPIEISNVQYFRTLRPGWCLAFAFAFS